MRTSEVSVGIMTLGHAHSSSLMLRLASHHLAVFRSFLLVGLTPLACRVAPAPAAVPARSPHTAPAECSLLLAGFTCVNMTEIRIYLWRRGIKGGRSSYK